MKQKYSLAVYVVVFLMLTCSPEMPETNPGQNILKTGPSQQLLSETVSPLGGTIIPTDPTGQLTGMKIEVPAGAYDQSRTFVVTAAQINENTLGENINIVSPLITINNGGGYADEPMHVTIPFTKPAHHFAMAFFLNLTTGELEGLPFDTIGDNHIRIITRHFDPTSGPGLKKRSSLESLMGIIIGSIDTSRLSGLISSGFTPGIDDWEFTNYGSYASPGGICAGMSVSAMWYYDFVKSSSKKALHHAFDSIEIDSANGLDAVWYDNREGIRFASMAQATYEIDQNTASGTTNWKKYFKTFASNDKAHYRAFAYSILATGKPQYVAINRTGGGHAMVIYAVNNGILHVADPNWPGSIDRTIVMAADTFQPYNASSNAAMTPTQYPLIRYCARSAVVNYSKLASSYAQIFSGTGGSGCFPVYSIQVRDGAGYLLPDTLVTDLDSLQLQVLCPTCIRSAPVDQHYTAIDSTGKVICQTWVANNNIIRLKPGVNRLGLYVGTFSDKDCSGSTYSEVQYAWLDFKWIKVILNQMRLIPADTTIEIGDTIRFRIHNDFVVPSPATYTWKFSDGTPSVTRVNDTVMKYVAVSAGVCTVFVNLTNSAGIVKSTGRALLTISSGKPLITTVTPEIAYGQDTVVIRGSGFGVRQDSSVARIGVDTLRSVIAWSDSAIVAVVPDTAQTGWCTVFTSSENSNSVMVSIALRNPLITSIVPSVAHPFDTVTVIGKYFKRKNSGNTRNLTIRVPAADGFRKGFETIYSAIFWNWTDTTVSFVVPYTATSGDLKVLANDSISRGYPFLCRNTGVTAFTLALDIAFEQNISNSSTGATGWRQGSFIFTAKPGSVSGDANGVSAEWDSAYTLINGVTTTTVKEELKINTIVDFDSMIVRSFNGFYRKQWTRNDDTTWSDLHSIAGNVPMRLTNVTLTVSPDTTIGYGFSADSLQICSGISAAQYNYDTYHEMMTGFRCNGKSRGWISFTRRKHIP